MTKRAAAQKDRADGLPSPEAGKSKLEWFHTTEQGRIFNGDAYQLASSLKSNSVDLIMTSPPFGLVREKEYGNVQADQYIDWFKPYAFEFHRVLKSTGSLVIDIGGAWNKGLLTPKMVSNGMETKRNRSRKAFRRRLRI